MDAAIKHTARRKRILIALFFAAIGIASVGWYWNRMVSLRAEADILIKTPKEAMEQARNFLMRAEVDASGYDLSQAGSVTADRMKGADVWDVKWSPKS